MKKITILTFVLSVFGFNAFAQESLTEDLNRFSVEVNVGTNKPNDLFSSGYYTTDPGTYAHFNRISHFDVGFRYMFNEKFGLELDGAYDNIQPEDNNGSLPFESEQYRLGLQGVLNLRNILNFDSFTKRFGLLAHGGVQFSRFDPKTRNSVDLSSRDEDNGGFMIGFMPQYRISDRFSVNLDATFLQNTRQHLRWDGALSNTSDGNLNSSMVNFSVGLTVYLGKHDKHIDWVDTSSEKLFGERVAELENRLEKIENDLQDTDKDGVADYLDREPSTTSGVAVNTKGESIDLNKNGIPDELESSLQKMYVTKEFAKETYFAGGVEGVKPDANDNLINVYFRFDSTQPEYYSLDAINQIVKYMRAHPEAEAVLTGYADQIGNTEYNKTLSENRAKKVYDIVIASGIDASRLSYKGGGIDDSVDKNSEEARQIVRRVSFELK